MKTKSIISFLRKVFITLLLVHLFTIRIFAQGGSCTNPLPVTPSLQQTTICAISNPDSSFWISFTAIDTLIFFLNNYDANTSLKVKEVNLYNGNCSNLHLLSTEGFSNAPDSVVSTSFQHLTLNSNYFVNFKTYGTNANAKIELLYQILQPISNILCTSVATCLTPNLLLNPDFESSQFGFNCTYKKDVTTMVAGSLPHLCNGNFSGDHYTIHNNIIWPFNNSPTSAGTFIGDHTPLNAPSHNGYFLMVDPHSGWGEKNCWMQNAIPVVPGTTYFFKFFARTMNKQNLSWFNYSTVNIYVNGSTLIGTIYPDKYNWTEYCFDYHHPIGGASTIDIRIAASPNLQASSGFWGLCDFAIDDLFFGTTNPSPCCINPSLTTPQIPLTQNITQLLSSPLGSEIAVKTGVTLTVNSNVTLSNYHIYFEPGSKIDIVGPSGELHLDNVHLQGCGGTWLGVICNNGGKIYTDNNTLIEGAGIGIKVLGGSFYSIKNTILNRNTENMYISAAPNYNGCSISNSIFTSRVIPHGTTVSSLKAPVGDFDYLSTLPSTSYTKYGIHAVNVYTTNTNGLTPAYNLKIGEPLLGKDQENVFDNLGAGIYASKCNILIQNNLFENMRSSITSLGRGVYSINATMNTLLDIKIGGMGINESNRFKDLGEGIDISGYRNSILQKNIFTNTKDPSISGTDYGRFGISIRTNQAYMSWKLYLNCSFNQISNYTEGVFWDKLGCSEINADINYNIIKANPLFLTSCTKAIDLKALPYTMKFSNSYIKVMANTITNVDNGILAEGFTIGLQNNYDNNSINIRDNIAIELKYNPYKSNIIYSGIKLTQCHAANIASNNNISSSSIANRNMYGIFVDASTNCKITCNTVSYIGKCFGFMGFCEMYGGILGSPGGFRNNTMCGASIGISLETNAVIGEQGTLSHASDNRWIGNCGLGIALPAFNINTQFPKFWARKTSLAIYSPITSAINFWPSNDVCDVSCNYNNLLPAEMLIEPGTLTTDELEAILKNINQYEVLEAEAKWMDQQKAYEAIMRDSLLSNSNDSNITEFKDSLKNETINDIYQIQELTKHNMMSMAKVLQQNMVPSNAIEENYKIFFDLYLRFLNDSTLQDDSSKVSMFIDALIPVAAQCPNQGGPAVVSARTLLSFVSHELYNFERDCNVEKSNERRAFSAFEKAANNITVEQFSLAPNPTDGHLKFIYTLAKPATLVIKDILGNQLYKTNLNEKENEIYTNVEFLNSGYYTFCVLFENQVLFSQKLIKIGK